MSRQRYLYAGGADPADPVAPNYMRVLQTGHASDWGDLVGPDWYVFLRPDDDHIDNVENHGSYSSWATDGAPITLSYAFNPAPGGGPWMRGYVRDSTAGANYVWNDGEALSWQGLWFDYAGNVDCILFRLQRNTGGQRNFELRRYHSADQYRMEYSNETSGGFEAYYWWQGTVDTSDTDEQGPLFAAMSISTASTPTGDDHVGRMWEWLARADVEAAELTQLVPTSGHAGSTLVTTGDDPRIEGMRSVWLTITSSYVQYAGPERANNDHPCLWCAFDYTQKSEADHVEVINELLASSDVIVGGA